MTISSVKYAASKASKLKTKKIGRRSICDIINDRPIQLDFEEKVNYIRHKFTYYEGNYDLFNDERGKPNKRKELLNRIIGEVVLKRKDPSILKRLNKKIVIWRKDKIEKMRLEAEKRKQKEEMKLITDYRRHDWYKRSVNDKKTNLDQWENRIVEFINSPENNLKLNLLQHIRLKRLKEVIYLWERRKGEFLDYNSIFLNKYTFERLVYEGVKDVE